MHDISGDATFENGNRREAAIGKWKEESEKREKEEEKDDNNDEEEAEAEGKERSKLK